MNEQRILMLQKWIKENPEDPFNQYALAMEYLNVYPEKSLEILTELANKQPDYLACYYQIGKIYEDLNETEQALKYYQIGIALAQKQNNLKTLNELQVAHTNLLYD